MQRVRARPRRGRDDTAAGAAEFGGEPIGHDLEFLHALERRRVIQIVRRAVALLGAVKKHCRRVRSRAVDEWPRAGVSAIHHTRRERDERIWIATHDRQLDHLPPGDNVPERRTLQLEVSGVSADRDLRLHRCDFERQIDGGRQADANVHVRHARAGESGKGRGDVVCADRQVRDGIDARSVCHRLAGDAGTRLCGNHCGAGDDASRFVDHSPGDTALLDLGVNVSCGHDDCEQSQKTQEQAFRHQDLRSLQNAARIRAARSPAVYCQASAKASPSPCPLPLTPLLADAR